jgi:hypothetical protein
MVSVEVDLSDPSALLAEEGVNPVSEVAETFGIADDRP